MKKTLTYTVCDGPHEKEERHDIKQVTIKIGKKLRVLELCKTHREPIERLMR